MTPQTPGGTQDWDRGVGEDALTPGGTSGPQVGPACCVSSPPLGRGDSVHRS